MLLGDVLAELGHATREEIDFALAMQKRQGGYVGAILIAIGAITREQLTAALQLQKERNAATAAETV
jgi:hypothetical protein